MYIYIHILTILPTYSLYNNNLYIDIQCILYIYNIQRYIINRFIIIITISISIKITTTILITLHICKY